MPSASGRIFTGSSVRALGAPAVAHAVDGCDRVERRVDRLELARMRLTCEVMVLSSTTMRASRIRLSRSFT
jgi:hypothetical protein